MSKLDQNLLATSWNARGLGCLISLSTVASVSRNRIRRTRFLKTLARVHRVIFIQETKIGTEQDAILCSSLKRILPKWKVFLNSRVEGVAGTATLIHHDVLSCTKLRYVVMVPGHISTVYCDTVGANRVALRRDVGGLSLTNVYVAHYRLAGGAQRAVDNPEGGPSPRFSNSIVNV